MAASSGIGIYISEDQIRVVKLRRTNRGISLQALGATPTPAGAMNGGMILDVKLMSEALHRVLKGYNITGATAAVCLPGRTATSRVLELPQMSQTEMRSVVAGEMEHYRMIPPGQGTFDFITLGQEGSGLETRSKVLLMAADKRLIDSYREALRQAGLQLTALEPFSFSAARASFAALGQGGIALLTVGARGAELSVFDGGNLRYSRQIDTGALDLVAKEPNGVLDLTDEAAASEPTSQAPKIMNAGGDLQSFLFEVQRSIDFYHRESPNAARVERVVLCADTEQLKGLDSFLERNLAIPVSLCDPFRGLHYSDAQFNPDYLSKIGAAFAPAVGLALRAMEETPAAPRMDLSYTGPEAQRAHTAPVRLTWALGVSIFLIILTIVAAWQLRVALDKQKRELDAQKAELVQVAKLEEEASDAARRIQDAQDIVQMRGLPWSSILQQVAEFMPQGSWLTSLSTNASGQLSLEGGAMSTDSVATLMDSLTRSPLFELPHMNYIQKETAKKTTTVKFQVRVTVVQPAISASTPATTTTTLAGGVK